MVVEEESIAKGKRAKHDYTIQIMNDFNELKEKGVDVEEIIAISQIWKSLMIGKTRMLLHIVVSNITQL